MKKNKTLFFIAITLIVSCVFTFNVSAKTVETTCNYYEYNYQKSDAEVAGTIEIYTDGTTSMTINNWQSDGWDDDLPQSLSAYTYYKKTKECPQYFVVKKVRTGKIIGAMLLNPLGIAVGSIIDSANERAFLVYDYDQIEDIKEAVSDNESELYISYLENKLTDTAVAYSCEYEVEKHDGSFTIQYNKDWEVVNGKELYDENIVFSMETTGEKPDEVCPAITVCYNEWLLGWNTSSTYLFYSDPGDCDEAFENNLCINESTNEECDPDSANVYICNNYKRYTTHMSYLWSQYKSTKNNSIKSEYDAYKEKTKNWCSQILENTNYVNPCAKNCLNLADDIADIEAKDPSSHTCGFSDKLISLIMMVLKWVKYIIPVAVIILGIIDFIKAVGADKEDEMKKAQQRFIKRLIAAALIFIVPFVIEFILDTFGFDPKSCGFWE